MEITSMFNSHTWSPGIGDPTLIGWVTGGAYLLTALLCFHASERCRLPSRAISSGSHFAFARGLWLTLFLAFLFLGINKQLDLQSLLTQTGRHIAHQFGWFAERRTFQAVFVAALGLFSISMLFVFVAVFRFSARAERFALVGTAAILGYVLIRAATMYHCDTFLSNPFIGKQVVWILEICGIGLVFFAALQKKSKTYIHNRGGTLTILSAGYKSNR